MKIKTNKNHGYGIKYRILLLALLICFVFEVFSDHHINTPTITEEIIDGKIYRIFKYKDGTRVVRYTEDGKQYVVYELDDGYTLYASPTGIGFMNFPEVPFKRLFGAERLYTLRDSGPDSQSRFEPGLQRFYWVENYILRVKNPEEQELSLEYLDYVWDDIIDADNLYIVGLDLALYPQTDYFDILLRSGIPTDADYDSQYEYWYNGAGPVNYYYLFRFDFIKEEVTFLSKTTMSSLVTALLGGVESDKQGFYDYTVEKTLTEDMVVVPKDGEVLDVVKSDNFYFYNYLFAYSFLYTVEKDRVTLTLTDSDNVLDSSDAKILQPWIIEDVEITTKTALQEGATLYSPDNMKEFSNTPWVSGMQDFTQEEIVLESENLPFEWLTIGNGFYRESRPDLFFANNRAKEIQIIYEGHENSIAHTIILQDSEIKQYIPLMYKDSKKLTIKILSVYSGTKYTDTCINYIAGIGPLNEEKWNLLQGNR